MKIILFFFLTYVVYKILKTYAKAKLIIHAMQNRQNEGQEQPPKESNFKKRGVFDVEYKVLSGKDQGKDNVL